MSTFKPLLLSMSVLALAFGSAYADEAKKSDTQAKPSMSQSGSASTGASGSASSGASGSTSAGASAKPADKPGSAAAGASGSTRASARFDFDKADKNKDGQLSREEFNAMMKGGAAAGGTAKKADKTPSASTKPADKPTTSK